MSFRMRLPVLLALACSLAISLSAHAVIRRVDSTASPGGTGISWPLAYNSLDAALAESEPGDELWIAAGTYVPTVRQDASDPRSATFLFDGSLNGIQLLGGFLGLAPGGNESSAAQANPEVNITRLSGDRNGDDGPAAFQDYGENVYQVVRLEGIEDITLSGLTIVGGRAGYSSAVLFSNLGAGIHCYESSPLITRCVLTRNWAADGWGGGMYVHGDSSGPRLVNSRVLGNKSLTIGGGIALDFGPREAEIVNTVIIGNVSESDPRGGGLCAEERGSFTLINSVVSGNAAQTGGPFSAGGVYISEQCPSLSYPGCAGEPSQIRNSIISGNVGDDLVVSFDCSLPDPDDCGIPSIAHSLVGDGIVGVNIINLGGNLSGDPVFIENPSPGPDSVWGTADDDFGDTHLYTGSPCINAGSNSLLPADDADLDGDSGTAEPLPRDLDIDRRVKAGVVDMGAFEFGCLEDLNSDCAINGTDLAVLLAAWTGTGTYSPCPPSLSADFNEDCRVNGSDLAVLLAAWGGCDCPGGVAEGGGGESIAAASEAVSVDDLLEWAMQATESELLDWLQEQSAVQD
jgi:hypothetical protein